MRYGMVVLVLLTLTTSPSALGAAPEAESRIRRILGEESWKAFEAAEGGVAKVELLLSERARLEAADLDADARDWLADRVYAAFPWREHYVDSEHQKDLFRLQDLITKSDFRLLLPVFLRFLDHEHRYVRLHGTHRLGEMSAAEHSGRIAAMLRDPDAGVRMGAVSALAACRARGYTEEVAALLADTETRVREHVAGALVEMAGREALGRIVSLLEDDAPRVRAKAAALLDELEAKEALPAVEAALARETYEYPRRMLEGACRTLTRLRGHRRPLELVHLASGDDSRIREKAILCVRTADEWSALWKRHAGGPPAPAVDFGTHCVIAILKGESANNAGISATATEDDAQVVVRFTNLYYQTIGDWNHVTPFGFFAVPLRGKPILLEEAVRSLINELPAWAERARFEE
jgi:HEAT repeat protein